MCWTRTWVHRGIHSWTLRRQNQQSVKMGENTIPIINQTFIGGLYIPSRSYSVMVSKLIKSRSSTSGPDRGSGVGNSGKTTSEVGHAFEKRIESLLIKLGKFPVRHNTTLRDHYGNLSQIDLKFGWLRPRYVECKCYSLQHKVPLEDVAKFAYVLRGNGISARRGLFVTSSYYKPRALTVGIECWDIDMVEKLEKQVFFRLLFRIYFFLSLYAISALTIMAFWESLLQRVKLNQSSIANILEEPLSFWEVASSLFTNNETNKNLTKVSTTTSTNKKIDVYKEKDIYDIYRSKVANFQSAMQNFLGKYVGYTSKGFDEKWLNRFSSVKEVQEASLQQKALLLIEALFHTTLPSQLWNLDKRKKK